MARISYVEKKNAPPEVSELFNKMEARGATVSNIWKTAAHVPSTLFHLIKMGNALLSRTRLDPKLREIAILRTAAILDCEYQKRAHSIFGKEVGVTDEQLNSIKQWVNSNAFNGVEQAVLRFTDEVAKDARVKDDAFSALAKHLDEGMMVELTQTVGFYGMLARMLLTFEVDLDDEAPISSSQITGRSQK